MSERAPGGPEIEAIDWERWQPALDATLLFVVRGEQLLLIHKKRGLGAGKLNAAGGKVDPGETPIEGAVREFSEELGARPVDPRKLGEVAFEVTDGPSIRIHVFRADTIEGEPRETEEAIPVWSSLDAVPYDRMWEDDRYWLPLLIENRPFEVRTVFTGDTLLGYEVTERETPPL
ncbi:MAG: 8-oxo-dGTP diphosphatase [Gemmatimonadetes bacterium]|nr:8-oxo-dGTP diphosphatase [Gemmatimonadota bacterium]